MPKRINDGLTKKQRYMNKENNRKHSIDHQRAWRQTDRGKFIRNRNHWIASGMKEPCEGWEAYWEVFKIATHCDACNIKFDLDNGSTSKEARCLDHHHHSGYKRNILCRKCNIERGKYDNRWGYILLEIHRYNNR